MSNTSNPISNEVKTLKQGTLGPCVIRVCNIPFEAIKGKTINHKEITSRKV